MLSEESDEEQTVHEIYRDEKVHVLEAKCSTCIFRAGNLMHLQEGRVKGMVDACLTEDKVIPCHQTIWRGDSVAPAICRGYFDSYGERNWLIRLAIRMKVIKYMPLPKKED